jgi:hypothetical protein
MYRLVAMSLLPIGKDTIVYGTDDAVILKPEKKKKKKGKKRKRNTTQTKKKQIVKFEKK